MLTSETVENLQRFVTYAQGLQGDERGEAQVFCERLFQAFGHEGYSEAGATLEFRVRGKGRRTRYADPLWRPRLLLEMKKRGEKLERHYGQVFDYWLQLVPQRPNYVVLCNFDEFWIYDFDTQLEDPVDRMALVELPERYTALNFLFPDKREPQFGNNRVDVTRAAADKVARVFNSTVARDENRTTAQRFILQCVVALFSEDFDLLPRGLFTELVNECRDGASTYDLIGGLFRQMGDPRPARGGRFRGVAYFNGGVFDTVDPVDLTPDEVELLADATSENWGKVQPQIFGTLFQSSMGEAERHAYGAHFTSEADIQKAVLRDMIAEAEKNSEVLFPYLIANDLIGNKPPAPSRYVIDFHPRDVYGASQYAAPLNRVSERVLPTREEAAEKEEHRNQEISVENPRKRVNRHHRNFLNKWWIFSYPRRELIDKIRQISRYIACSRHTKRPIFEFVDPDIRPNDALQVFPLPDDYSFGILQSDIHWLWFVERCSTIKRDFRYTSNTVFDSFAWPQSPSLAQVEAVAAAAFALRDLRRRVMEENGWNFRELYRTLELPGANPLKDAHHKLDTVVRAAYGIGSKEDTLTFLLRLNEELAEKESKGIPTVGPGLPPTVEEPQRFITSDRISVAEQR
jgi:hypothetical protein